MKRFVLALVLGACSLSAQSALIDRGGGLIYDDDLDVTWMANANVTGANMTWEGAMSWADGLNFGGFTDWRLADTLLDDPTCRDPDSGGPNCRGSEFGHLFYDELGGVSGKTIHHTHNDAAYSLFENIAAGFYWSRTRDPDPQVLNAAYIFYFGNGTQGPVSGTAFAWAVHDGDIGSSVPIPAAVWLFGSALGLLGWMRRLRSA